MAKITSTDETINIPIPVKAFGKSFATYNETLLYKKNKVRTNENITLTGVRPKVLSVDSVAPYDATSKLLNVKVATDNTKPFIGIITASAVTGNVISLIKKGIVDDTALTGGSLNQEVYVNTSGEFTFDVAGLKVGRVVQVSPKKIFVNLTRSFDELNQPIFLSNPGKNLYYTLRFLSYYLPLERYSLFAANNAYDFRTNHLTFAKQSFIAFSPGTTQKIYYSNNLGKTWGAYNIPENNVWEGAAYNDGEFSGGLLIACASTGTSRLMVSSNFKFFRTLVAPQINNFKSLVYANGKYIGVAETGASRVVKIVNGVTPWTSFAIEERTSVAKTLTSVASNQAAIPAYVAVAEAGTNRVLHSPDGLTWTAYVSANESVSWRSVCGYPLKFVAVGDNAMMYSADGITWTPKATGPFLNWRQIITTNVSSTFLAISNTNSLLMDYSLTTITNTTLPGGNWEAIAEGNSVIVAVGLGGAFDKTMRSTNFGTSWTMVTDPINTIGFNSIAFGNNLFVAVSNDLGINVIYSNDDGLTWNTSSIPESCSKICFSGGKFLAISNSSGNIYHSVDAITWKLAVGTGIYSNIAPALSPDNKTIAIRNGVANISFIDNESLDTVLNNLTVTAHAASEANSWKSVTYGNGLYVAVSSDGTNRVMTSVDGTTWVARSAAEANSWQSVTFGNGVYVAVASDGANRVMTSIDGIVWTAHLSTEQNSWQSVKFGNDLFYAVSSDGTNRAMKSKDGVNWTIVSTPINEDWKSVSYGLGVFMAAHSNLSTSPSVARTAFL